MAKEQMHGFPPLVIGSFLVEALSGGEDEHYQAVAEELAQVVKRLHNTCLHVAEGCGDGDDRANVLADRIAAFSDMVSCDYFSTARKFNGSDPIHKVVPFSIWRAMEGDLARLTIDHLAKDWTVFVAHLGDWGRKAAANEKRIKFARVWAHNLVRACEIAV